MFVWVLVAHAAEPIVVDLPGLEAPDPDVAVLLPWSTVGFSPAAPESAAFGPDHLAVGPDGRWAIWDPVQRVIRSDLGEMALDRVDDLAFASDGDLLVLNTTTRTLSRWEDGALVDAVPVDELCPSQVSLVVRDGLAGGVDVFGNVHPIGDLAGGRLTLPGDARLLPPEHRVRLRAGVVEVDGMGIEISGAASARMLGDWVIVELGARGAVRDRVAVSSRTGRAVSIGARTGHRYRPTDDVSVGADGVLAWLSPDDDGLRIQRVSP